MSAIAIKERCVDLFVEHCVDEPEVITFLEGPGQLNERGTENGESKEGIENGEPKERVSGNGEPKERGNGELKESGTETGLSKLARLSKTKKAHGPSKKLTPCRKVKNPKTRVPPSPLRFSPRKLGLKCNLDYSSVEDP